ncbi:MAG: signal recognition particle-docking protein FtsY, partial [Chlamydiae bacterium]|nr:signal recognition particle-docking protein FtsY [Chlamydiota bacterium]
MFDFLKTRYQKIKRIFFPGELTAERKEELEQTLYEADLGSTVVQELIDSIDEKDISNSLKKKALEILQAPPITSVESTNSPHVILMIGVNGAGKTTTTAKLANHYQKLGKKVLVAAADTFRAGAIEQLDVWAKKLNLDIVKGRQGA